MNRNALGETWTISVDVLDDRGWPTGATRRTNVQIDIDMAALVRTPGSRASRNKSGKATAIDGMIVVREIR